MMRSSRNRLSAARRCCNRGIGAVVLVVLVASRLLPQCAAADDLIPSGLVLFGSASKDKTGTAIRALSADGTNLRTLYESRDGTVMMGRVSPDRRQMAFGFINPDRKLEIWQCDAAGRASKLCDGGPAVTAWSHDGNRVAFYQERQGAAGFSSHVVDLRTKVVSELALPHDYVADDWHPRNDIRTAMFMNSRNVVYRRSKGDHYPTRQLDLIGADGRTTPITKDPVTDSIWSRFSPTGDRIAYYQRFLEAERSNETVVVCQADGSEPKTIFSFMKAGDAEGIVWFRPNNAPAWSPDGKILAWLVSHNTKVGDDGSELLVVFMDTSGDNVRRVSLTKLGITFVTTIDWR